MGCKIPSITATAFDKFSQIPRMSLHSKSEGTCNIVTYLKKTGRWGPWSQGNHKNSGTIFNNMGMSEHVQP